MVACFHELRNVFPVCSPALFVQFVVESEVFQIVEKEFFKVGRRCIVRCFEECEKVFEHSAGCPGGRNKLHDLVFFSFVAVPSCCKFLYFVFLQTHNAIANRGCALYFKERKTVSKIGKLLFKVGKRDAF